MSEGIIIAIIGAGATIGAAIIAKIATSKKNTGNAENSISIKQKQKGNNNTQIGTQNNNYNTTTIQIGEKSLTNGEIIIDGGNASGGGKIEYKPEE